MRKQKKDWGHNRFLKQQEERKSKKAYAQTRKVLSDMCRIVGHDAETTRSPSFAWFVQSITNRCRRCGANWVTHPHYISMARATSSTTTTTSVWLDVESTGTYSWTTGSSV